MFQTFAVIMMLCCLLCLPPRAHACSPEAPYLLGEDALHQLDFLEAHGSTDSLSLGILAHNLSFSFHDKLMTEKALAYLSGSTRDRLTSGLIDAYRASGRMLAIRDQSKAQAAVKTIFGLFWGSTPKGEARKQFRCITSSLKDDPKNRILLFLHATAAIECAEYLPDLLIEAERDLRTLEDLVGPSDSAELFLLNLSWAKLYVKSAQDKLKEDDPDTKLRQKAFAEINAAKEYLQRSSTFACRGVYVSEVAIWSQRITKTEEAYYAEEPSD